MIQILKTFAGSEVIVVPLRGTTIGQTATLILSWLCQMLTRTSGSSLNLSVPKFLMGKTEIRTVHMPLGILRINKIY